MSHEYSVALRIRGSTLIPAEITAELGLIPSRTTNSMNRDWGGHKGTDEALWEYNGSESDEIQLYDSLDDGLQQLLREIWPVKDKIAEYQKRHDVFWWCGHFQTSFDGGPTLLGTTLKMLGELGIDLYIDTYHTEEDSEITPLLPFLR